MLQRPTLALALAALVGLAACGGGGDSLTPIVSGSNPPPEVRPPGETMSPAELALAMEVLQLVNDERENFGLEPLEWDEVAAQVAFEHCVDMRVRKFYDHVNPDGTQPGARLRAAGIKYRVSGENLYYCWPPGTPAQAMGAWMASDGHRANILDQGFTHIGIGVHDSGAESWWTQEFYRP